MYSSFPVIHKIGKVGIFVLLRVENKLDRGINHFSLNPEYHDKCKFPLKFIRLLTVSNLFILKYVHKWQRCQFGLLREDLNREMKTFNCRVVFRV